MGMLNASLFTVWLSNFFNVCRPRLFSYYLLTTRFVHFSFTQWFTGESTSTIYSRYTSHVRCDYTHLVNRDSLPVVARLQDT